MNAPSSSAETQIGLLSLLATAIAVTLSRWPVSAAPRGKVVTIKRSDGKTPYTA